jgi:RND family efflux transporter MFP subunit
MKKRTRAFLLVTGVAATFAAGAWFGQQRAIQSINAAAPETSGRLNVAHAAQGTEAAATATDAGAHDHSHHSQAAAASADHAHHSHGAPEGAVAASAWSINVAAEQQSLLGVRVGTVDRASGTQPLRLFGRVAADESRIYKLNAGADGSIREVSPVTTGTQVKKDQVLATFTAPSAATVIQLYMTAAASAHRAKNSTASEISMGSNATALAAANIRQRIDQLHGIGMSTLQMEEMARTGEPPQSIRILAPAGGFIMARNVSPGQTFEKGAEFFRIADLRRVWIVADVFEKDAQYLKPGTRVEVSLPQHAEPMTAKVSAVLPQFDATSRTLKVRFEADNPGFRLRPDMLVDVTLKVNLPEALAVPIDAVIDSGLKKTVFVEKAPGQFEPREVQTGRRLGERVEILKGLADGERIVTSGTFFLDSESRMKLAMERMQSQGGNGGHAGHHHH